MSDNNWGGPREGAGRKPLKESQKKKGVKIYITENIKKDIELHGIGENFSQKAVELIKCKLIDRKTK